MGDGEMDLVEIRDLLPAKPFGVEVRSSFTPIVSLVEESGDIRLNSPKSEVNEFVLPVDPFGMEIISTFTQFPVSLEKLDAIQFKSQKPNMDENWVNEYLLPADPFGTDIMSMYTQVTSFSENIDSIQLKSPNSSFDDPSLVADFSLFWEACECIFKDSVSFDSAMVSVVNLKEISISSDLFSGSNVDQAKDTPSCEKLCPRSYGSEPHEAMFLSLRYLGVSDLLSVERVCRSLRDAIKTDTLLWKEIHIYEPLSYRINDDALLNLTNRAQGILQCLNLVQCMNITDDGLQRVLHLNPKLEKLSVPECVRLTMENIMDNLKAFKSAGTLKIKYLRVGGIKHFGLTDELYEELKFLLGAHDGNKPSTLYKPQNYGGNLLSVSCDEDRAIDIETCPRCQKFNLVYDCPREGCQGKHHTDQPCRACALCIRRCFQCGGCIENYEYEETFLRYFLCMDCVLESEVRLAYHETSYVFYCG